MSEENPEKEPEKASSRTKSVSMDFSPRETERAYTTLRKYGWIVTVLIGVGGQFFPVLGLAVPFIMAAMIGFALLKGLYFCGNICPHGSFFDVPLRKISPIKKVPYFFKTKGFKAAVLLFFLYNFTTRIAGTITAGNAPVYIRVGSVFSSIYLVVLVVAVVLGRTINSRTWCHFCPMRTIQIGSYRLGRKLGLTEGRDEMVTINDKEKCIECGNCSQVCPLELRPYPTLKYKTQNDQLENEHCMRCRICVENCPVDVLEMDTADV